MATTISEKPSVAAELAARILNEGYGSGAWHGPDLKAAIDGVQDSMAYRRPAPGRHNIAEIALHHAYYVRSVRGQISGAPLEPFVLDGDDWFAVSTGADLPWSRITAVLHEEYDRLVAVVNGVESGRAASTLSADERFGLVLGITCHAVYHAGQVQLIKRLAE